MGVGRRVRDMGDVRGDLRGDVRGDVRGRALLAMRCVRNETGSGWMGHAMVEGGDGAGGGWERDFGDRMLHV